MTRQDKLQDTGRITDIAISKNYKICTMVWVGMGLKIIFF